MKNKLSLLLVSFFLFSCAENKQVTEQQTTFCNPMNLDYGWGCFQKREKKARTAADPVIVLFKDKYYLFTTMDIGGYRVSDDLIHGRMSILIRRYMHLPLILIIMWHLL